MNSGAKCSGAVNIVMSEPKTESKQLGSKRGPQNPRPRESGIEAVRLKKRVPKPEDPRPRESGIEAVRPKKRVPKPEHPHGASRQLGPKRASQNPSTRTEI